MNPKRKTSPRVDAVKRAVRLHKERQRLKGQLAKVEAQLAEACEKALEWMQANTIPRLSIDGTTAHIRRELFASAPDVEALRAALEACGIDPEGIIKERANGQTLSALVREFDRDGKELPEALAQAVKVSETYKLGFLST